MAPKFWRFLALAACVFTAAHAQAEPPNGEAVFYQWCARCHVPTGGDLGENRAPSVDSLAQRTRKAVRLALTSGVMWGQGGGLSHDEREAVIAFLVPNDQNTPDMSGANRCAVAKPLSHNLAEASWSGWGNGTDNTRFQKATALTAANIGKLKLKWAFGIQDTGSAYSQPVAVGGRLFFGSGDGTIYALDAETGCTIWTHKADSTVRSALNVQSIGNRQIAFFGDSEGKVYALDATDGKQLWKSATDDPRFARITGAPQVYKGVVYVGVNGTESYPPMDPNYVCCTFRGSVVAFDALTGKQVWKTYVIPQKPALVRRKANGVPVFAPAGAGVWAAPTIDPVRNAIYAGTGDCHVSPAANTCDSMMAFDLATGKILWHFEGTANDAYNLSCPGTTPSETCSDQHPDFDFGSSAILRTLPNGKRLLLAGQKSGVMHALDPDDNGKVVWETRVGQGSAQGGIMWGSAADDTNVYAANVKALLDDAGKPLGLSGLTAMRIDTGKVAWRAPAPKPPCDGQKGCTPSQTAAVSVVPGLVFGGSKDGHLRAYSTGDGKLVWDLDTLADYTTVNGVKAHGGSMGSAGATIVGDMLYIGSGYGAGGMPGNVLLAYRLEP